MSRPQYQYEAVHLLDRSRHRGLIQAQNEREARERLREQDLIPTRLSTLVIAGGDVASASSRGLGEWVNRFRGVGLREKIAFSRSLGMMLKAGVPITEALTHLETYGLHPAFRRMLRDIRQDVLAGATFGDAIARQNKAFDPVYCAVMRAGEASGDLVASLTRMTDLLTRAQRMRSKLITSLAYPAVVMLVVIAVFTILTMYVLPTFEVIYDRMGVSLPWPTQAFLWVSHALRGAWFVWLPLGIGAIVWIVRQARSQAVQERLQARLMRLPWLGEVARLVGASHFLSTLSVAFAAGVPIIDALPLAAQTVPNPALRRSLAPVALQIQAGERLTGALAQSGVLGDIELLMTASGEESGELDVMLRNAFEFVEEELNQRLDILVTLLEPLALVLLGLIVGAMALAIYLPMFNAYEML
ncbi:MAG: type II secretion system F family protein [Vampirovibrionales bacterium]|nr:type II secretion system F family protein [Vampirovibrionales bacterium]